MLLGDSDETEDTMEDAKEHPVTNGVEDTAASQGQGHNPEDKDKT
jgi:hypothetical protein